MVSPRAFFGTALGLAVAGCAVGTGPAEYAVNPALPSVPVAVANRMAASSIMRSAPSGGVQVASLQPVAGEAPLVRQGTVLWHREESPEEAKAKAEAPLSSQLQTLNQNLSQWQGQTQAQLAALQARQEQQDKELRSQALTAVTSVAQMSKQALAANAQTESHLKDFAELKAVQESRRAAADAKVFTAEQLARTNANTAQVLAQTYRQAGQHAEQVAAARAGEVARQVAQLAQSTSGKLAEIEQTTVKPDEARAIALQSVADSKDYIKTVARTTVQDESDPAMTQALSNAASNVITKNDKVVFAIRRAIAEELQGVAQNKTQAPAATRLGPDHADGKDVELDPNHLKIAGLLAPEGGPAPDAAKADASLAALSPAAGNAPQVAMLGNQPSLRRAAARASWMDIRQYKVVVHQDNQTLEQMLSEVLASAEPFTGPWQVKWRISDENKGILAEKFSLDAETSFDEFLSYIGQYVMNDRGVKLSFSLFDTERVIVISD